MRAARLSAGTVGRLAYRSATEEAVDRFEFGAYALDYDALAAAVLHAGGASAQDCALPNGPTTFVEVYGALRKERFISVVNLFGCKVKTSCCEHAIEGPAWALRLLDTLGTLEAREVAPFGCTWFYYGREVCLADPQEAFRFFLVDQSGIVAPNTRVTVMESREVAPPFLHRLPPPEELWSGEGAEWRASILDWYNQFYEHTHTGRVMVLREDGPRLFGRERPTSR